MSPLSAEEVLLALGTGWTLKSHRYLDGQKAYRLHPLDNGEVKQVSRQTVRELRESGLIDSNKKFPAATYLLTDRGRGRLEQLRSGEQKLPLTSRGWQEPEP